MTVLICTPSLELKVPSTELINLGTAPFGRMKNKKERERVVCWASELRIWMRGGEWVKRGTKRKEKKGGKGARGGMWGKWRGNDEEYVCYWLTRILRLSFSFSPGRNRQTCSEAPRTISINKIYAVRTQSAYSLFYLDFSALSLSRSFLLLPYIHVYL